MAAYFCSKCSTRVVAIGVCCECDPNGVTQYASLLALVPVAPVAKPPLAKSGKASKPASEVSAPGMSPGVKNDN